MIGGFWGVLGDFGEISGGFGGFGNILEVLRVLGVLGVLRGWGVGISRGCVEGWKGLTLCWWFLGFCDYVLKVELGSVLKTGSRWCDVGMGGGRLGWMVGCWDGRCDNGMGGGVLDGWWGVGWMVGCWMGGRVLSWTFLTWGQQNEEMRK